MPNQPLPPPLPLNPIVIAQAADARSAKALERAELAVQRADVAANHALEAVQLLTKLRGEFDEFKGKCLGALGRIEGKLGSRASKSELRALESDVEDTKTRILREDIEKANQAAKSAKLETKVWRGAVLTIFVAVVAIVLKILLGH